MSLKHRILRAWYGPQYLTLEWAGQHGWLPRKLQRTDEYIFGCRPFPGFYDDSRWN